MAKPTTITITNFGGRLTRYKNGDLNSGMAKFDTSFGYDPFSKPGNLTWLESPTSIAGTTDLLLAAKSRFEQGTQYIYAVGNAGKLYKIQPSSQTTANVDSVIGVGSVAVSGSSTVGVTFVYPASMEFFGDTEKIYIASDTQVNAVKFDFGLDTAVTNAQFVSSVGGHNLRPFLGKLAFGNGNTVGAIAATGTVTSSIIGTGQGQLYSELNPPLPVSNKVHDVDVSPDGNYLLITASEINNEQISNFDYAPPSATSEGFLYNWNGIDEGVTAFNKIPSYAVTALQTYLDRNLFFSNDAFGASLNDGGQKLLTLPNNRAPIPTATLVNGNFVSWVAPEVTPDNQEVASLYYFGGLDRENPTGLYRLLRYRTSLTNGFIHQTPLNILTNSYSKNLNTSRSSILTVGLGKHYFSTWETSDAVNSQFRFYRFLATPTGEGTAQSGVYETQTQLFSKRIHVDQVRVYTEGTTTNNAFRLDLIGADGGISYTGTYTYVAGSDITKMEGSMERINFNPDVESGFAVGVRITNTGTANMTISKIEVDVSDEGR